MIINSLIKVGSVLFFINLSFRMCNVSNFGIEAYKFLMSKKIFLQQLGILILFNFSIISHVFLTVVLLLNLKFCLIT